METEVIRERLQEYIRFAEDKKVRAIYTMVESEIKMDIDLWEDEDFLNEINARVDDYESGKVQGISWEEVKKRARNHRS
ncbi:addiction module protein [Mucilaginibacter sp. AW1-7]|jgi:putative addiction module component (TIGR02574 family)|uniref:addiction module protein n=1 Tax=unclassified Mucilaginibacter TaxID=2617802 RepID=UPI0008B6146C|nr:MULTISPECIES: addiction module protein [unclassified Mucilaginibacter]WDF79423.1 addiction module protein [Mucilaginibacter sp. KACC 22773]SEP21886.1 putative addiction module component, TIGR02574 family [Mucilaginibacter sp. OK283]